MIIPKEIKNIISQLEKSSFEAYIVGGSVRDFLLGIEPKDWDITTDAKPQEIIKIFPDSFYENQFFTVGVKTKSKKPHLEVIEVTTYRNEGKYSDQRHPDEVGFAKSLEEDLSRRDFTVNAMAMDKNKKIIDPFGGGEDLKNKIIKTVGNPNERFNEDALRMVRAVRFASVLNFSAEGGPASQWKIEEKTAEAIKKNSILIKNISHERIRDEFVKIIMSDSAKEGIETLRELDILKYILPEMLENYGVGQNKHHIYDCYTHALKSLEYTVKQNLNLYVRLASLFHDIGKPRVKLGEGVNSTFYNHEVVGAKMVFDILNRLKFPKKDIEKITKLVRYHLFYYNVGEVTESSVRRLIKNVGKENVEELLELRQADRIGSGVPKAEPYKLRHLKYIIDKVSQDPISVKMLKVGGNDIIKILNIEPGPKVGQILDILLGYVLDDPKRNKKAWLEKETKKLGEIDIKELKILADKSKEEKTEIEVEKDKITKQKYWVT